MTGENVVFMALDDPRIVGAARQSCSLAEAEAFAALLQDAATRPWARAVGVVTSHENLFLTSRRVFADNTPAGRIQLTLTLLGDVLVRYSPPHGAIDVLERTCRRSEAVDTIEQLFIPRLLRDHGKPGPGELSADKDREHPHFAIGDSVRVILNERNRTARTGAVSERIWHYKDVCWNYYLVDADGKKVKKRYYAEDLDPC